MFGWFKRKPKQGIGEQEAKKIMDAAIDIVVRYGKVGETLGTAIVDASRLPVRKPEMKAALKLAWRFAEGDQRMRNWTEAGYALLANFQEGIGPEPIDCKVPPNADPPTVAAILTPWLEWSPKVQTEMTALVAEFEAFKRSTSPEG